jgi:hypothetical protein
MGVATVTQNALLNLIFRATAWANYADNAATTPETNIIIALHTADPGIGGAQNTSELAYTNYARQNVARTTGGWSAPTVGSISPAANINFPSSGAAGGTATFFSAGKSGGGASPILWSGTVTPNIAVSASGITPQLTTASTITLA